MPLEHARIAGLGADPVEEGLALPRCERAQRAPNLGRALEARNLIKVLVNFWNSGAGDNDRAKCEENGCAYGMSPLSH
jgi:hypothetical protein